MQANGITWHAVTLDGDDFAATKELFTGTFGLTPVVDMEGFVMMRFPDGTMLELYAPDEVPDHGFNSGVAFGFRVDDLEAARAELAAAGVELLDEITRMPKINYAYCHFRGPGGRVYGLNERKPQPG